jgi:hypothetical protein
MRENRDGRIRGPIPPGAKTALPVSLNGSSKYVKPLRFRFARPDDGGFKSVGLEWFEQVVDRVAFKCAICVFAFSSPMAVPQ